MHASAASLSPEHDLPAKPGITKRLWKELGAEMTADGTIVLRSVDQLRRLQRYASAAARAACLATVSCARTPAGSLLAC